MRLVAVGDEVVAEVLHGRRARGVGGVGVRQAAGRVHEAGKHVAHGVDAGLSGRAHPEHGVRIGQVAQRDGVGGVEHHDHAVEMGARLVEQVFLLLGEGQVADRQVGRLAARAADDHHGGVGVVRVAVAQLVGELAHGALVHGVVALARDIGGLLAVILAGALLVEVPGGWVDLEARLLERLLEGVGFGGVHRARARAAVDEVHGVLAQQGHAGAARERQRRVVRHVVVAHQHDAAGLHLARQLRGRVVLLVGVGVVGGEVGGVGAALHLVVLCARVHGDGVGEEGSDRDAQHHGQDADQLHQAAQQRPEAPQEFLDEPQQHAHVTPSLYDIQTP